MDHHVIGAYSGTSSWASVNISGDYGEQASYDGNGNILTYKRYGTIAGGLMDNLTYNYTRDGSGNLLANKLGYINDAVASNAYTTDLDNQAAGNYTYDNNGNLIADPSQNLGMIYWTVYGKMAQIYQGSAPANGGVYGSGAGLAYGYDPGGNRVTKTVTATSGTRTTTHYVRDAQGNVLAVYQYKTNSSGGLTEGDWVEQHLYGSSRLGMLQPHVTIPAGQAPANDSYNSAMDATIEMTGNRLYELNNHLGNVLATVTDVMNPPGSGGNTGSAPTATIVSAQDYYPFGMEMPGRTYLASWAATPNYRYGYNGKEKNDEIEGVGNEYDYGMRGYDSRIGRFWSVDPLQKKYPELTPYQYASNTPIQAVDLDGLEKQVAIDGSVVTGPVNIDAVNASILANHTKAQQAAMKQAAAEKYMQDFRNRNPQQGTYQSNPGHIESTETALFRANVNDPDNIGGQAAYSIANNLHDARVDFKEGNGGNGTLDLLNAGITGVTLTGAGPALGVDGVKVPFIPEAARSRVLTAGGSIGILGGAGEINVDAATGKLNGSFKEGDQTVIFDAQIEINGKNIMFKKVGIYGVSGYGTTEAQNTVGPSTFRKLIDEIQNLGKGAGFEGGSLEFERRRPDGSPLPDSKPRSIPLDFTKKD